MRTDVQSRGAVLAILWLSLQACYVSRPIAAVEISPSQHVRLESTSGIRLLHRLENGTVADTACTVWRMDGRVRSVLVDTLVLEKVKVSGQAVGGSACMGARQSLVVLQPHSDLSATRIQHSPQRTTLLVLIGIPVALVTLLVIECTSPNGCMDTGFPPQTY